MKGGENEEGDDHQNDEENVEVNRMDSSHLSRRDSRKKKFIFLKLIDIFHP